MLDGLNKNCTGDSPTALTLNMISVQNLVSSLQFFAPSQVQYLNSSLRYLV